MRSIPSTTIVSTLDNDLGYCVQGYVSSVGSGLPTTASTFQVGCEIRETGTGFAWANLGTVAVPVWETRQISKTVTLSAAEIFTLYSVGKEIIPAIPGKIIIIDEFELDLTGTATQFTGGGVVNLQYGSTVHGAGTVIHADIAATVVTNATARVITKRATADFAAVAVTSLVGLPVWLGSKTADFAAGTGTAVVKVRYHFI